MLKKVLFKYFQDEIPNLNWSHYRPALFEIFLFLSVAGWAVVKCLEKQ
jgi:hypothetical protein